MPAPPPPPDDDAKTPKPGKGDPAPVIGVPATGGGKAVVDADDLDELTKRFEALKKSAGR